MLNFVTCGTRPDMTREFIERAKEAHPIALIAEGTRIDVDHTDESESKVYEDAKREIERTQLNELN